MDPLERLTNLVTLLLETRQPLTLEQIADELAGQYPASLSARRSAFERDKALLRAEGVPIGQTVLTGDAAGQTGYWINRADFELTDVDLSPDERGALQVALAMVHLGASWGHEAWWKLEQADDEPLGALIPVAATLPVHHALPILYAAVRDRSPIEFEYRGRTRRLDPYGLLARDGHWYVVGRDVSVDELRAYRLDRFDSGEVDCGSPGAFERPEGFRAVDAFPANPLAVGDPDRGSVRATVLIDADRVPLFLAQSQHLDHGERRRDGSLLIDVPCVNRAAFRSWLFELGPSAEVVGPPDVRAEVIEWLHGMVAGGQP